MFYLIDEMWQVTYVDSLSDEHIELIKDGIYLAIDPSNQTQSNNLNENITWDPILRNTENATETSD